MSSPQQIAPELLADLRASAAAAAEQSYTRYSGFLVKAAVATIDGRVHGGSNVEVVNYSLTKHAEEVAILRAIGEDALRRCGDRWLAVLYVIGAPPCGSCRQFAWEWASEDAVCVIDDPQGHSPQVQRLSELLPGAFGPDVLPDRRV